MYILENGEMVKDGVKENSGGKMDIIMLELGKKEDLKDMVEWFIEMEMYMKGTSMKKKDTVEGYIIIYVVLDMRVNGKMIYLTEMVLNI